MKSRAGKALIWTAAAIVVAALVFIAVRGCTAMPWNRNSGGSGTASVWVTRDFGRVTMKEGEFRPVPGGTVMDAVRQVASVETSYGGGFVEAIEGLRSGQGDAGRQDWFYYVNGVLAGVGAGQYKVGAGDILWWDYHQWNQGNYIPAVIGAYPAPFTRGYSSESEGCAVVYGEGMKDLAVSIEEFLEVRGADVAVTPVKGNPGAGAVKMPSMTILSFEEAARTGWVKDLVGGGVRTGSLIAFVGTGLVPLDASGRPVPSEGEIDLAVVSTGSGMGDAAPVWLVLCKGTSGIDHARRALTLTTRTVARMVGLAMDTRGVSYPLPR